MFSVIVCIKRKKGLSLEEFSGHWRNIHAGLISENREFSRHIIEYKQYHKIEQDKYTANLFGEVIHHYDGIGILSFLSKNHWIAAINELQYVNKVRPDEFNFIDIKSCKTFVMSAVNVELNRN